MVSLREMDDFYAISGPAGVLIGLAAICGLFTAWIWARVASSVDTDGEAVKGPNKRMLGHAALMTSITMGLACFGYLLGKFGS